VGKIRGLGLVRAWVTGSGCGFRIRAARIGNIMVRGMSKTPAEGDGNE